MQLKRGLRVGRLFGIPLVVHVSWYPAAALLVLHLVFVVYGDMPVGVALGLALCTAVGIVASLLAHELAHAVVARSLGIGVADVTLFVFGGVARIAREPARPAQEAVVAVAGPLASAWIGATALILAPDGNLGAVLSTVAVANFAIAVFNLLPGFPLDGGRLLRAWMWSRGRAPHEAALVAGRSGQLLGAGLAAGGIAWTAAGSWAAEGLWLAVLGVFLIVLATASRGASQVAVHLERERAGDWARPFGGTVTPETSIGALAAHASAAAEPAYAVVVDGRLAGVVHAGWLGAYHSGVVGDVMVPWTQRLAYPASGPVSTAVELLTNGHGGLLVVIDDAGSVVGTLDVEGVRARLRDARGPGVDANMVEIISRPELS